MQSDKCKFDLASQISSPRAELDFAVTIDFATSFPGSAWERTARLRLARATSPHGGEAEPRGSAFPGRAWERGFFLFCITCSETAYSALPHARACEAHIPWLVFWRRSPRSPAARTSTAFLLWRS